MTLNIITGKIFVFTGKLSLPRSEWKAKIEHHGGIFTDNVTKQVNYVISSEEESGSNKISKAKTLGIPIHNEEWLIKMLGIVESKTHNNDEKSGEKILQVGQYTVTFSNGIYSCTCPAWKYQKLKLNLRTCKHIESITGIAKKDVLNNNTESKVNQKVTKPDLLLAEKFDFGKDDPTGWYMSIKYDGCRSYWNGTSFVSRLGNIYDAPPWFTKGFPKNVTFDGELYLDRGQFNTLVGIVKSYNVSDEVANKWKKITYFVFDIPCMGIQPFEERMQAIEKWQKQINSPYFQSVNQEVCKGLSHLEKWLNDEIAIGGEGAMLRKPRSLYVGKRSKTLLKCKRFYDIDATVIEHLPGKGKYKNMIGALMVHLDNGVEFKVGSGLNDLDRINPPPIGSIIIVRYQELGAKSGVPRFPTYLGIRGD